MEAHGVYRRLAIDPIAIGTVEAYENISHYWLIHMATWPAGILISWY